MSGTRLVIWHTMSSFSCTTMTVAVKAAMRESGYFAFCCCPADSLLCATERAVCVPPVLLSLQLVLPAKLCFAYTVYSRLSETSLWLAGAAVVC